MDKGLALQRNLPAEPASRKRSSMLIPPSRTTRGATPLW